jgi:hypothetical protein
VPVDCRTEGFVLTIVAAARDAEPPAASVGARRR